MPALPGQHCGLPRELSTAGAATHQCVLLALRSIRRRPPRLLLLCLHCGQLRGVPLVLLLQLGGQAVCRRLQGPLLPARAEQARGGRLRGIDLANRLRQTVPLQT